MSTEATVAIIMSSVAIIGALLTFLSSAKKNELEILRGIIDELKKKIEGLDKENHFFRVRLERALKRIEALMKGIKILLNQLEDNHIKPIWTPEDWCDDDDDDNES